MKIDEKALAYVNESRAKHEMPPLRSLIDASGTELIWGLRNAVKAYEAAKAAEQPTSKGDPWCIEHYPNKCKCNEQSVSSGFKCSMCGATCKDLGKDHYLCPTGCDITKVAEQPVELSQELSLLFALQSVCDYIRNRHNYGNQVAAKRRIEVLQKAEAAMQAFGDKSATQPKREDGK